MYGAVPKVTVDDALPLLKPWHCTSDVTDATTLNGLGSVMVAVAVAEPPQKSLTVTVYVPALKPVAAALVWNDGDHR